MKKFDRSDRPYKGSWVGVTEDALFDLGVPMAPSRKGRAAQISLASEALLAAKIQKAVRYSRRPQTYTRPKRYAVEGFTYTHTLAAVRELLAHTLIMERRSSPGSLGEQSVVAATDLLINAVPEISAFRQNISEFIILKDCNKYVMDYEETSQTRRWREAVLTANEVFRFTEIELPLSLLQTPNVTIDGRLYLPGQRQGFRVFNNNDWSQGGRFYGLFWQWLSPQSRQHLRIAGEEVDEPDFNCIHPQLLGALTGRRLVGDAYYVPGIERNVVKKAWNIAINASNRTAAIRALADELGGNHLYRRCAEVIERLVERHSAWTSAFFTGTGLKLQHLDSDLMFQVLQDCFDDGFCALPVHDSFITQVSKTGRVREFMDNRLTALLEKLQSQH